jgi:hypothetical protein
MGSMKGKTKKSKSEPVKVGYVSKTVWKLQEMHIDLMFVKGDIFLVSVLKPSGLTMITSIQSKSTAVVKVALEKQLAAYANVTFNITTILTGGEGAVVAMTDYLQSIGIQVENKISQIKERVRATLNTLR